MRNNIAFVIFNLYWKREKIAVVALGRVTVPFWKFFLVGKVTCY